MRALGLYEKDFYAWTQEQARLIKEKSFEKLDLVHLFDEVESMGASEVRELESRLEVLLAHLLKWSYQPNLQCRSWQLTIKEQRHRIKKRIKKMPSLKPLLPEIFTDSYEDAIYSAIKETGLDEAVFPTTSPWTIEQVLDDEFYPV
jgi:hypothetical protein